MTRRFVIGETVEFNLFGGEKNVRGVVIDVQARRALWGKNTFRYTIRYETAYGKSSIIRASGECLRTVPPLIQLAEAAE